MNKHKSDKNSQQQAKAYNKVTQAPQNPTTGSTAQNQYR